MENLALKAYTLYKQLKSYRKVAKVLYGDESKHETVRRLINSLFKKPAPTSKKQLQIPPDLKTKLNMLLLTPIEKKGKTDFMSFSQVFEILEEDFKALGIKKSKKQKRKRPPSKFYEFINNYIISEFGSIERFEQKRRNKKEKPEYNLSKHALKRELGSWEIDATGFTHNGKSYVIVQAIDRLTMYAFEPLILEVKEDRKNKHHNKSVNQTILGQYLQNQFIKYQGVPVELISDKDKTITSKYIHQALKMLGTKQIKKWKPNQKLIERVFRSIKDEVKALIIAGQGQETDFIQLWQTATKFYNEKPHNFEHIKEPVIPAQLIQELGYGLIPADEEVIRKAFSEKIEVSVVNNRIRIDGDVYEFIHPELDISSPLGRKRKNPRVLVERDLENTTKLFVYTLEGKFLGVASLVSKALSEITAEHKEKKGSIKRLEKKAKELEVQAKQIRQEKQKISQSQLQETDISFEELLQPEEAQEIVVNLSAEETTQEPTQENNDELLDFDPLKIYQLYKEEE